jgi:hypothetical protein
MDTRKIEYELTEIRKALQTIARYVIIKEKENKGKQNETDNKEGTARKIQ